MKTALVIGINGNFGHEMAQALKARGWQIRALARSPEKFPTWVKTNERFLGDSQNKQHMALAANGCDLLVYAANPPYHRWPELALAMLEPTCSVAEANKLHILFPGNVYGFQPQPEPIHEQIAQAPFHEKASIRIQMEQRLKAASERGARVTIVRAGDFIGPNTRETWLDHSLKQQGKGLVLTLPNKDQQHRHFWTYLPDFCANSAMLLEQESVDAFSVWHDAGFALTEQDWTTALKQLNWKARTANFPWWVIYGIAWFNPIMREVIKMRYLWRENVVLDGRKWQAALGERYQETALEDLLTACFPEMSRTRKIAVA